MKNLSFRDVIAILRFVDAAPPGVTEVEFEGIRLRVERKDVGDGGEDAAIDAIDVRSRPASPAIGDDGAAGQDARRGPEAPRAGAQPAHERAGSTSMPPSTTPAGASATVAVKPPMAGVFYASPSPGAAPFVEVGRRVRAGDQVGIVEVMKLFTSVLAPCDGVVRSIDVANEATVLADQTLMTIEPAGKRGGDRA
ncbi:MAG TPA: hypothetical protein PLM09_04560 [Casimicrobiaceae bacterium]|nr:hypothetical protein [Casimicrobiaceae bacterium]